MTAFLHARFPHRCALPVLAIALASVVLACGSKRSPSQATGGPLSAGTPLPTAEATGWAPEAVETPPTAPFEVLYKFDPAGSLPLTDPSEMPVAPGSVTARWYTYRGWYAAVFEGLNLAASGPLCVGTSILNAGTSQVEHATSSPTTAGACDDHGAGAVVLVSPSIGIRVCDGIVSYVTEIPADIGGTLFASLTVFLGDGTGVGISSRFRTVAGTLGDVDSSVVSCGPLPEVHVLRLPTPTPAPTVVPTPVPASTGSVPAEDRVAPPAPHEPGACVPADTGKLQDVVGTAAGPYLVHHPDPTVSNGATVIFLPGGSGGRNGALRVWQNFFASGAGADAFRVVIPYSVGGDFIDDAERTLAIWNEVLWCYGGDPARVHLAGASNGGLAAYGLMLSHPEYFATLLGAPGAFPVQDPSAVDPAVWREKLAGRAVFNGVGAYDSDWRPEVIATHNALAAAGIVSLFVEFAGQGHIVGEAFDESVFFAFWMSH